MPSVQDRNLSTANQNSKQYAVFKKKKESI